MRGLRAGSGGASRRTGETLHSRLRLLCPGPTPAEHRVRGDPVLFVTGTGTGVGKTVVTAALAALGVTRGPVAVVKPAQTGVGDDEPGDLAEVRRLAGPVSGHELVRYPSELSPAAAARIDGRPPLDPATLYDMLLALREDLVLVEGAGGLLVRYDEDGLTLADMARALRARVLVV